MAEEFKVGDVVTPTEDIATDEGVVVFVKGERYKVAWINGARYGIEGKDSVPRQCTRGQWADKFVLADQPKAREWEIRWAVVVRDPGASDVQLYNLDGEWRYHLKDKEAAVEAMQHAQKSYPDTKYKLAMLVWKKDDEPA